MKVYLIFFAVIFKLTAFSQSKKDQIEILNSRVDSLYTVLSTERSSNALIISNLNSKIKEMEIQISSLTSNIAKLNSELLTSKTENNDKQQEITDLKSVIIKLNDSINIFKIDQASFNGRWCNSDTWDETGTLFQLDISTDNEGNINAVFFSGGPFEENYIGKSSEGNIELYFNSVGGSISFNDANNSLEKNSQTNCKKNKYAICKVISPDEIQIITYKNTCSNMPANTTLILKKLDEDASCP